MTPSLEIAIAKPGEIDAFWTEHDRAWKTEVWAFKVIWHEQSHDITAMIDGVTAGALRVRIAASLAHVEALYVLPAYRKNGIGRALLARCEETANYYNCHKVSAAVMNASPALEFYLACGYKLEAVLAQHTFKLDVAMVRKFLL